MMKKNTSWIAQYSKDISVVFKQEKNHLLLATSLIKAQKDLSSTDTQKKAWLDNHISPLLNQIKKLLSTPNIPDDPLMCLFSYCIQKDSDTLTALVSLLKKKSFDATDAHGNTLFHILMDKEKGNSSVLSEILHLATKFIGVSLLPAYLQKTNSNEETSARLSVKNGFEKSLLLLLDYGSPIEEVDAQKNTLFHTAIESNKDNILTALSKFISQKNKIHLLTQKNNLGNTLLHLCVKLGYQESFERVWTHLPEAEKHKSFTEKNNTHNTLLHEAALSNHITFNWVLHKCVDFFLSNNSGNCIDLFAPFLQKNSDQHTPFDIILIQENEEKLGHILEIGIEEKERRDLANFIIPY